MAYIEFKDIIKKYIVSDTEILANNKVNFSIEKGEFVIIVGPSGAGKSTTLNILGGMDTATSGEIIIDNIHIEKASDKELTKFRRNDIGFIFQFYNLIPNLTTLENVELASDIVKDHLDTKKALELVGLSHRLHSFPSQLSGGEQQRVSIARAIAKKPKILLCDEPTGALDYHTSKTILKLLHDMCKKVGTTVILITHNNAITPMADRVIEINDAKVRNIYINNNPISIDDIEW